MSILPHNFRGWLQVYFTGIETILIAGTLIVAFCFPHGIPHGISLIWRATALLLIVSALRCLFYDRKIALTGIVALGFVALFRLP